METGEVFVTRILREIDYGKWGWSKIAILIELATLILKVLCSVSET